MALLNKVDYAEYIKTTAMFYVDEKLEQEFEQEITYATDTLWARMKGIATMDGLKQFIKDDEEAIEKLINLMNISSEKFKRVITTLRLEKGHTISGEWDLAKIRTMMIQRPVFMDEVCDLLANGANDPKFKKLIPQFYLENFVIDSATMARLSNPDDLRRLIKKGVEGRYNNQIGDSYYKAIQSAVERICFEEGLTYVTNKHIPLIGRPAHFAIPNERDPRVIIDLSYNITTSSTQSRFKAAAEQAAAKIRDHNASAAKPVAFVNVLDGAGWVGRQADFRAIHLCSTYALHITTLDDLKQIIDEYC